MQELKVPMRRIAVEVCLVGGARVTGFLFHAESPYQTASPGDIAAELNDERDFVPFDASDDDRFSLLAKRHLLRIRIQGAQVDDLEPAAAAELEAAQPCELEFDDGTRLTGRPALGSPAGASRLLDKLNQAPTFLHVVTANGIELVNMRRIVRVSSDMV